MYNSTTKKDYISYNPNNNQRFDSVMTNYFNRAEESELAAGKDLGEFTVSEIIGMYKSFCTPSIDMLVVINNQFQNYTTWYMKNVRNIDNQNHYREMRRDILMQCISFTAAKNNLLDRNNLLTMIKDFANPYEQFLYLALFEGIKGEQLSDFYELRVSDFDTKKMTVSLPGRVIPVSKELIHYANDTADEYIIYNINGEPTNRGRFLEEDDRIIKCSKSSGFELEPSERTGIIYRMMRKTKRYDFVPTSLSVTSIYESGRCQMIKELFQQNTEYDLSTVIRSNLEQIELRYGRMKSIPKWIDQYGEYCKG